MKVVVIFIEWIILFEGVQLIEAAWGRTEKRYSVSHYKLRRVQPYGSENERSNYWRKGSRREELPLARPVGSVGRKGRPERLRDGARRRKAWSGTSQVEKKQSLCCRCHRRHRRRGRGCDRLCVVAAVHAVGCSGCCRCSPGQPDRAEEGQTGISAAGKKTLS